MHTPIQFDAAQPCEGVLNDFFSDQPADRCIDCPRHVPDPRVLPRDTVYLEPKFGRREGFLVCLDRRSEGQPWPAPVCGKQSSDVGAVAHTATVPVDAAARESVFLGGGCTSIGNLVEMS